MFKSPYCSLTSLLLNSGHPWLLVRKWQEAGSQGQWEPSFAVSPGDGKGKLTFSTSVTLYVLSRVIRAWLSHQKSHCMCPWCTQRRQIKAPKAVAPHSPDPPFLWQGNHKPPCRHRNTQSDLPVFGFIDFYVLVGME